MSISIPVITIDGCSGSGKGSVGLVLAKELVWHFLDSGALYRALAFAAQQVVCSVDSNQLIDFIAHSWQFFCFTEQQVIWKNQDITAQIRTQTCASVASHLASNPQLRQALLPCQHAFRQAPGLVADGRDMGTVVFPDAQLKIFLHAQYEERARRRYLQLKALGIHASLDSLRSALIARDDRDQKRSAAPLQIAEGALVIDTTHQSVAEVVAFIKTALKPTV